MTDSIYCKHMADRLYAQADALECAGRELIKKATLYRNEASVWESNENKESQNDKLDEAFL